MADPVPAVPSTPAPAAAAEIPLAAVSAPAVAEPAPASQAPAQAATSPVTTEPTPAVKPAEPAPTTDPVAPAPTLSLLEQFDKDKADAATAKAPAAAPADAAPASPPKPAEASKQDAPAAAAPAAPAAPFEYKYTLPESMQMDDAVRGDVHKAFDTFRTNPAEGAQALVNLYEARMQEYAKFVDSEMRRVWSETKQGWAKQTKGDPELGGSGYQTSMTAVARMRDLLVPEKHRPAFEQMLAATGVGDHPEFLRILHQAARLYDEPTLPPPNPRPPSGNGQRPARRLRDIYSQTRTNQEGQ